MKYLLTLLLIPSLAYASPTSDAISLLSDRIEIWKAGDVIYARNVDLNICWTGNPTLLTNKRVTLTELQKTLKPLSSSELLECWGTTVWNVAPNPTSTSIPQTRPMKNALMLNISARIVVGLPCEDEKIAPLNSAQEYHYATNGAGVRGVTLCQRSVVVP